MVVRATAPVEDPDVVGSNCTSRVDDWPGLRVTGNFAPGSENPAPLADAAVMVTAAVPVDVMETD